MTRIWVKSLDLIEKMTVNPGDFRKFKHGVWLFPREKPDPMLEFPIPQ
jgi:hypothetical protein